MLCEKKISINRPLRRRDIATIVSVANHFQSEIHIKKTNKHANLKSVLGVFALGLTKNDEVTIVAYGPDSEKAVHALLRYFVADSVQQSG